MWKNYSAEFMKQNRASSISVVIAAFISALFLSLLCCLAYNFWTYEIESIVLEEGDWQGRITGTFEEKDITIIESFANVEKVKINEELSEGKNMVVDIYFQNMKSIYQDMPLIAEQLGLDETDLCYHEMLLSRYMVNDPQDENPPLLMMFYLGILLMVSLSLILIIHNSFAVSMNARVHQFGIFSSIGATPSQIRFCLIQEAVVLCTVPILIGSLIGIAVSYVTIQAVNWIGAEVIGRHEAVFQYQPLLFVVTVFVSALTVLISAWIPARKLSKLTPLQAIQGTDELCLKRKKHSRILSMLFGIEGELAGNALKAQKKAFRTSTLSLTLSFLSFTLMLCFFTLSGISTNHTYFERYQNAWDVMVTVQDTDIRNFVLDGSMENLQGVESSIVYQKIAAICPIEVDTISDEVINLGGLEAVASSSVHEENGMYKVKAPIVVMDDESFAKYCIQLGIEVKLDGSIILNRIWDSINSNFRYKEYVPFVREDADTITLQSVEQEGKEAEVPVLAYAQEPPVLREEYENYALVQFISLSLWNQIYGQLGGAETDLYICVLAEDGATLDELNTLETELSVMLGQDYVFEMENRIQERLDNDNMIQGYMLIVGAICFLLALIGIANVFSNTLGFLHQRRREFARYLSIGMTPVGMRKMFCIEALVIAGRPLLITLPITVISVSLMITVSYLDPAEFLANVPVMPVILFILAIFGFVSLAYYMGGKKIVRDNLSDALRNDSIS